MLDWIMRNKEWIFSGVGLVFIGWLFLVAGRVFMRRTPTSLRDGSTLQDIIEGSTAPSHPSDTATSTSSLTPKQIIGSISALPFLQQLDAARHYVGLAVKWNSELADAKKVSEGSVRLIVMHGSGSSRTAVVLEINPNDYSGIGLLKKGAHIEVEGLIESVSDNWVSLQDARIRFRTG